MFFLNDTYRLVQPSLQSVLEHFQHLINEVSFVFIPGISLYLLSDNKDDWDMEAGCGGKQKGWLVGQGGVGGKGVRYALSFLWKLCWAGSYSG